MRQGTGLTRMHPCSDVRVPPRPPPSGLPEGWRGAPWPPRAQGGCTAGWGSGQVLSRGGSGLAAAPAPGRPECRPSLLGVGLQLAPHRMSVRLQEEELVELLARHCYVQLGASVGREAVQGLLPSCVPPKLYRTKPPEQWAGLVAAALAQVSLRAWLSLGGGAGGGPPSGHRNLSLPVSTALGPQVYPGPFRQRWSQARPTRHLLLSWHRGSGWLIPLVSTAASVRVRPSGTEGPRLALPWPSLSGSLGPGCLGPALILPPHPPWHMADSLTQGGRPAHPGAPMAEATQVQRRALQMTPSHAALEGGLRWVVAGSWVPLVWEMLLLCPARGGSERPWRVLQQEAWPLGHARHSRSSDRHLGGRAPLERGCCSSA